MTKSSIRSIAASALCAFLVGCSSSSTTPQGLGAPNTDYVFHIRIHNQLDKYVWLTRYYSYKAEAVWHIDGASCVAPGITYDTNIHYVTIGTPQAKLRVEVKDSSTCTHTVPNGDRYGPKCDINFDTTKSYGTVDGNAAIKYDNGFEVTGFWPNDVCS